MTFKFIKRDPKRIPLIMSNLQAIWQTKSQLSFFEFITFLEQEAVNNRLGHVRTNVFEELENGMRIPFPVNDLFNVEDGSTASFLSVYMHQHDIPDEVVELSPILELLQTIWLKDNADDLRFFQFISYIQSVYEEAHPGGRKTNLVEKVDQYFEGPFSVLELDHVSDETLERFLNQHIKKMDEGEM